MTSLRSCNGTPVEFVGRYVLDSIGNEHEITHVQPLALEVESVTGMHFSVISLPAMVAHEDDSEDRGTLEPDDRLTCHAHNAWATEAHILTH